VVLGVYLAREVVEDSHNLKDPFCSDNVQVDLAAEVVLNNKQLLLTNLALGHVKQVL
jgi:hypothetical protein